MSGPHVIDTFRGPALFWTVREIIMSRKKVKTQTTAPTKWWIVPSPFGTNLAFDEPTRALDYARGLHGRKPLPHEIIYAEAGDQTP